MTSDIKFLTKLCAIENRLSVLEQLLLHAYELLQRYQRLMEPIPPHPPPR